jgi:uncharacterized protein DUF4339
MMLDDQGVTEEWIVRVQGKEYGPVNIETLREWKAEGRLLPANDARPADIDRWTTAAEIPGLFSVPPAVVLSAGAFTQSPAQLARRSFAEILAETVQIYRKGFFQFLGLTLLVLLPSVCSQLTTAFVRPPQGSNVDMLSVLAAGFAFLMFILSIVMWPVYIAGIQILTAEIVRGNRFSLLQILNEAVRFWPRVAGLALLVYGGFLLLTIFGVVVMLMMLAGAISGSLLSVLLALGLTALQIWLFCRFFIYVLFCQQFVVLENANVYKALRESRTLARSGENLSWYKRPLWRGAVIFSIWTVFVVAIKLVALWPKLSAEWPLFQNAFQQLSAAQDPQVALQKLMASMPKEQAASFSDLGLSILQAIFQPLLGIALVVLYLDSKLEVPSHVEPIVRAGEGDAVR